MTLLAVERIKLFSTRSPWWCSVLAVGLVLAGATLVSINWTTENGPFPLAIIPSFLQFGIVVVMVMAALSVTTEYRFGTIRATFQAVPSRTAALSAKTAVVALVAAAIGLVASFGAWAVVWVVQSDPALALTTAAQWRAIAGAALVAAVAAVLAVAVAILVRQTAGAVSIVLVWALLVENLVYAIPTVGPDIHAWLPFTALSRFLTDGLASSDAEVAVPPLGPWASLAYVAALAAALLVAGLAVANRRDA